MNGLPCVLCHRTDPGEHLACPQCLGHIAGDIDAVLEYTALSFEYIAPKSGGDIGALSGRPGSRPPIDIGQIDAQMMNDALPLLSEWEKLIRHKFALSPLGPASLHRTTIPDDGPVPATLTGCAHFLRAWLPRVNEREDFPLDLMAGEIRRLANQLRRFDTDRPLPAWRVPCPADHPDHGDLPCGCRLPIDRDDLRAVIECPRCRAQWTADRLLLVALADPATTVWATLADCEAVTGVTSRTLQRWAGTGLVARRGTLYDVGSAMRTRRDVGA